MPVIANILAAWKRLHIRRLYNSGDFVKSRTLSLREISSDLNRDFAVSIVLRSHYNEGNWSELIAFTASHPSDQSTLFSKKAESKLFAKSGFLDIQPKSFIKEVWNEFSPLKNWYQEGSCLWFRHPKGWVFWDMPKEFVLSETNESLLFLAMNVLLKPFDIRYQIGESTRRPFGQNAALSYSGGIDSTAAAALLPEDTILSYHRRSFPSSLNHGIVDRLFERWKLKFGRTVLQVPSNHELIRSSMGLPVGFSSDFAAGVHLILLSDTFDLGILAFGTPIDNTWLEKGSKFRDFSSSPYWIRWKRQFANAGLHLEFPINHISEGGAMKVCQITEFIDYVNSCLRGNGLKGCGKCWKCFNKNGPLGRKIDFESYEIQTFLHRIPMPTAMHALWSIHVQNLEHKFLHLQSVLQQSFDWWEKYYPPGLDLIGEYWRDGIEENTRKYLQPMPEPIALEQVNLYRKPPLNLEFHEKSVKHEV